MNRETLKKAYVLDKKLSEYERLQVFLETPAAKNISHVLDNLDSISMAAENKDSEIEALFIEIRNKLTEFIGARTYAIDIEIGAL